MSDITLTSGIRQNLLSLQQTSTDLTTTQEALATGKKVNSAADNPSSYFTSQSLTRPPIRSARCSTRSARARRPSTKPPTDSPASPACCSRRCRRRNRRSPPAGRWRRRTTGSASLASTPNVTLTAGTLAIDVGTSTYSVTIAASATLAQVEADINGTTGLGSNGVVTATDDGSGHLILTSNEAPLGFTVAAQCHLASARSHDHQHHQQRRDRIELDAGHAAEQLQQPADADQSARLRLRL